MMNRYLTITMIALRQLCDKGKSRGLSHGSPGLHPVPPRNPIRSLRAAGAVSHLIALRHAHSNKRSLIRRLDHAKL